MRRPVAKTERLYVVVRHVTMHFLHDSSVWHICCVAVRFDARVVMPMRCRVVMFSTRALCAALSAVGASEPFAVESASWMAASLARCSKIALMSRLLLASSLLSLLLWCCLPLLPDGDLVACELRRPKTATTRNNVPPLFVVSPRPGQRLQAGPLPRQLQQVGTSATRTREHAVILLCAQRSHGDGSLHSAPVRQALLPLHLWFICGVCSIDIGTQSYINVRTMVHMSAELGQGRFAFVQ